MTIIAADGKTMACDTQGTGDSIGQDWGSKIARVEQGLGLPDLLIGFVADYDVMHWARGLIQPRVSSIASAQRLWDTYQQGAKERGKVADGDARGAAVLMTGGVVYCAEANGNVRIPSSGRAASGCGASIALGAMFTGAGPETAVRAAMSLNIFCGGRCIVDEA